MSGLSKDRLIFDPADATESDNIGAYLRAGSDGDLLSSTNVGGKEALDVNLVNASVVVSATDLDIRDLDSATDSVTAIQGTSPWVIGDGGGSITVDGAVTVAATDLDIRDLSHTQDSIQIGDGTDLLAVNADGSINVNLTDDGVADDAADAGNPLKVGSRAVSGALAAVSATNDRADLLSDMYRRVYVNDSPNIGAASDTVEVDNAAEVSLAASPLAGRRRMMIQNLGPNDIYVGPTGLAVADGLRVGKGATLSLDLGQNVELFAISASATASDVRVFELA